ncbi:hypothetical protein Pint_25313 [Pistacia integerrima]|uniref:Uncharacterized protein n=1 Tax=Pistacia integerrima TaxID=434235 RepID=A0ACC0YFR7_9ROSI|nr:hypothetical protein Pint_25313 [Pistacia integerrima]
MVLSSLHQRQNNQLSLLLESVQKHHFIMAHSLNRTRFSQRGHSCEDSLSSIRRFQRFSFHKKMHQPSISFRNH